MFLFCISIILIYLFISVTIPPAGQLQAGVRVLYKNMEFLGTSIVSGEQGRVYGFCDVPLTSSLSGRHCSVSISVFVLFLGVELENNGESKSSRLVLVCFRFCIIQHF